MSNGFLRSFIPITKPLAKKLKKYRVESVLILLAFLVSLVSLFVYIKSSRDAQTDDSIVLSREPVKTVHTRLFVDLSGSVEKPDVYEVSSGARLKHVLALGGGLSADADRAFFARNFNLARFVQDQEKIYIPSAWEINAGIFTENARTVESIEAASVDETTAGDLVNINTASTEELDELPGVGQTTADKIIQNRPYQTIEELLTKKVVNKNTYEKIKGLIIY